MLCSTKSQIKKRVIDKVKLLFGTNSSALPQANPYSCSRTHIFSYAYIRNVKEVIYHYRPNKYVLSERKGNPSWDKIHQQKQTVVMLKPNVCVYSENKTFVYILLNEKKVNI